LVLLIAAFTTAVLSVYSPASVSAVQPEHAGTINVLTLGDSYSAGNGAFDSEDGYVGQNPCHRSEVNYSEQYVADLRDQGFNVNYKNRACSGWVTSQVQGLIEQPGVLSEDLDIVLMTIGGNDAKFSSVAAKCMVSTGATGTGACLNQIVASYDLMLGSGDPDGAGIISKTQTIIDTIRVGAPNAQIVLLGYPNLIGACNYEKGLVYDSGSSPSSDADKIERLGQRFPDIRDSNERSLLQIAEEIREGSRYISLPVGNILRAMQAEFTDNQRSLERSQVHYVSMNGNSGFNGRELMCGYESEYLRNISLLSPTELAGWVHPNIAGHNAYKNSLKLLGPENWVVPREATLHAIHHNTIVFDPTSNGEGRSYFYDDRGVLHHIPDQQTFQCIKHSNNDQYFVKQSALDAAPLGADIRCANRFSDVFTIAEGSSVIVRTVEGDESVLVSRPAKSEYYTNAIKDSATFNCLGGWDNLVLLRVWDIDSPDDGRIPDAHCFNGSEAIAEIDGHKWLIQKHNGNHHYQRTEIQTQAEHRCLISRGLKEVQVSSTQKDFYRDTRNDGVLDCYDSGYYEGRIVSVAGEDHFISSGPSGPTRHYIPNAETYNCLVGRGHPDIGASEKHFIEKYTDRQDDAECFDDSYYGGKIVDFGTNAKYFIAISNGERKYHHIPDGYTYECLVAKGHQDIGEHTESYISKYVGKAHDATCIDKDYWHGNIANIDGESYYLRSDGTYQWLRWQGEYSCYVARGSKIRSASRSFIDSHFSYTGRADPFCIDSGYYKNKVVRIAGSSASYFVSSAGTLQHIGSTSAYYCLLERSGVSVRSNVELGYLKDGFRYVSGNTACHSKAKIKHDVVYADGRYWFTHDNGKRYLIKDAKHEYCMRGRYGYEGRVDTADLRKYTYSSHRITCKTINDYRGKMIRYPNGGIYYVDSSGRERSVSSWEHYKCFARRYKTGSYKNVPHSYHGHLPNGPSMGQCKETGIRGKIIRRSDGRSYWITSTGKRYWIPDGHTFNCFGGWGNIVNDVTHETHVHYRYYGHARCYRGQLLNGKVIRHSDGDAHYVFRSGKGRYWMGNGSAYWRYIGYSGAKHINVYSRWLVNSIPYKGAQW
ncbi:MAG: SGNH/GDSL hydrolase family protein, partial [Patescibacteria group bacterium]